MDLRSKSMEWFLYDNGLRHERVMGWMFFFNSIKEINEFRKLINRLLRKGMSNIYLKVTTEKKCGTQSFNFLSLKSSSPGQFSGNSSHTDIELSNFLLQLRNQRSRSKTVCRFCIFILKGIMTF